MSEPPRLIFALMTDEEKQQALARFTADLAELEREREGAYPRVVRDAIEETIVRYRRDIAYLQSALPFPDISLLYFNFVSFFN